MVTLIRYHLQKTALDLFCMVTFNCITVLLSNILLEIHFKVRKDWQNKNYINVSSIRCQYLKSKSMPNHEILLESRIWLLNTWGFFQLPAWLSQCFISLLSFLRLNIDIFNFFKFQSQTSCLPVRVVWVFLPKNNVKPVLLTD